MLVSENYDRALDRIGRSRADKPPERILAEIRDAFFTALGDLPDGLRHGLFNYYARSFYERMEELPEADQRDERQELLNGARRLGRVVDVFNREYDEVYGIESDEEWRLIGELTNEYSQEMDLKLLTYVMNLLLQRGLLG